MRLSLMFCHVVVRKAFQLRNFLEAELKIFLDNSLKWSIYCSLRKQLFENQKELRVLRTRIRLEMM